MGTSPGRRRRCVPLKIAHAIPLVKGTIERDDLAAVTRVVRRGGLSEGETTHRFERAFARFLGVTGGVATSSGTAALHLALAALEIGPGDEVIFPSYTCTALLHATLYVGSAPRLVDNRLDVRGADFNLAPEAVARAIGPRTKAIIVPHMFGTPADLDQLLALGLPVIEDPTQAVGARHRGRPLGSLGTAAIFSFHASKMLSTGEGGMVLARTPELLSRLRDLNDYEGNLVAMRMARDERTIRQQYRLRYNYRMTDAQAALGLNQLRKLPAFVAGRRTIARIYNKAFSDCEAQLPALGQRHERVFFRYLIQTNQDVPHLLAALRRAGIEGGRGVYPALHQYLGLPKAEFENAEAATASLLSVPLYPSLRPREISRICREVRRVLAR